MSAMNQQPVALVTGASRGLGRALALKLSAQGYHIIAIARTVGGLESLDDEMQANGGHTTLIPTDISKPDSLLNLGPQLAERFGRLDVFVANAGMLGDLTPMAQTKPLVWDTIMAVNVTANHRLIGTLDPLLRSSKARVVFVTSRAAQSCKAYWSAYAASKAAVEAMGKCYAAEVEKAGVCVNLFDPGAFRSTMRAQAYPGEDAQTLPDPIDIADKILPLCQPDYALTAQRVAA